MDETMIQPKVTNGEAKVLQALRAGAMDFYVLQERFPGVTQILTSMTKQGWIENGKFGWQITAAGRAACPSRREIERAEYLPQTKPIEIKPTKPKVETISLNSIRLQSIKQPEVIMPAHTTPSVAKTIRDAIKKTPGIEHDQLIAEVTENSKDAVATKKAYDMINYVLKHGGFTRCNDIDGGKTIKRYYSDQDYLKRKEKAKKVIDTKVPTLEQHHAAERLEVNTPADVKPAQESESLKFINDNEKKSALDVQEGGDHYKRMKIQPIEYITANDLSFIEGSIVKYISRWKNKNGVQDLKKARHFIDILIEQQGAA